MKQAKTSAIVTKDSLKAMLDAADHAKQIAIVGRALVVLFNGQTASEQSSNATNQDNSIGFASCDAFGGSLTAKSYIKNRTLQSWQLDKWTKVMPNGYPKICKYARQLNLAAMQRVAKANGQQTSLLV